MKNAAATRSGKWIWVLMVGMLLSFGIFLLVDRLFEQQRITRFLNDAENRREQVQYGLSQIRLVGDAMRVMIRLRQGQPLATDLNILAQELGISNMGLAAVSWRVPGETTYPVQLVAPANTPWSEDPASAPTLNALLDKASTTLSLTVFMQTRNEPSGPKNHLSAFLPVFQEPAGHATPGTLYGFIGIHFEAGQLIESVIAHLPSKGIDFLLTDQTPGETPAPVFFHSSRRDAHVTKRQQIFENSASLGNTQYEADFALGDRVWHFQAVITELYPDEKWDSVFSWIILNGGILFTLLLTFHLLSQYKQRRRLFLTLEIIPAFVAILDRNYRIRFANQPFSNLFGLAHHDPCYTLLCKRTRPCLQCHPFQAFHDGRSRQWEWTNAEGHTFLMSVHAFEESRKDELIMIMGLDITARKQAELALEEIRHDLEQQVVRRTADLTATNRSLSTVNALLKTQQDTSPDGVVISDAHSNLYSWNRQFLEVWGLQEQQVHRLEHTLPVTMMSAQVTEPERFIARIDQLFANENEIENGIEIVLRDGRVLDRYSRSVHDEQKQCWGRIWFYRDITTRKRLETELRVAKEAAESANQAKSAFLATMSHEIRSPLNIVLGMIELLRETELTLQQQKFINAAHRSGQALLTVISDILDISKIEAGQMDMEDAPFLLKELLHETVMILSVLAQERGLSLTCEPAADLPDWVMGDAARLRQVLLNLMGNALKFTQQGGVRLSVTPLSGDGIQFEVKDTGIGIPADKLSSIFQPFLQADSSITRRFGGTGLGLAICRQLVQRMGGEITVESEPGQGSLFRFTARLPSVNTPAMESMFEPVSVTETAAVTERALAILLIDDTEENHLLIQAFLRSTPYALSFAFNGKQGFDMITQGSFDLVLMDIEMPVMDGYEATTLIRQWETSHQRPRMPIIALSAHAMRDMTERMRAAGCHDYLTKPMRKADLLRTIRGCIPG
ncbi:MAG: response regulator [Magnetococcales bacterium]|nr:response regulator [Magnetococcales bacterium]